jgi:hypothetical protein
MTLKISPFKIIIIIIIIINKTKQIIIIIIKTKYSVDWFPSFHPLAVIV